MNKHLPPLLAIVAGTLLGLWALSLPAPAGPSSPGFSAVRAKADIDVIARAPHPVWDPPSLTPVREHIRARLAAAGLQVTTWRYPEISDPYGHRYPLENIGAALPGRSGSSVLLVSHYDSSPPKRSAEAGGSHGAADDGYGVAAMLELAGILAKDGPKANGVRFLFTDAEETGLLGAIQEMKANFPAYRDVNLVINLEARGIKGPAVMFETGRNNRATLDLFRHARRAFAYSFAVDVYRRMPNGTDFTAFLARGLPGLNFAVLDDLSYYHTPRDHPDNVCLGSLQHYGEQILPVVRAYAADPNCAGPQAFTSTEDMEYFSWLPGVFLAWPASWDHRFCLVLAAAFLLWAGREIRRGRARPGPVLGWFLAWLGIAAAALAAGLGLSWTLAKVLGKVWRLTYLPNIPGEHVLLWTLVLGLGLLAYRLARGRGRAPLLGALALDLAFLGLMAAKLPGGTFLFSMPLLVALVALAAAEFAGRPWPALVAVSFIVSLFLPVLHLFTLALTFGALGVVLLLAAVPMALVGSLATDSGLRGDA